MEKMSYAKAGVDIDLEEKTVSTMISAFGYERENVEINGYKIVLCTDGVGSKVMIANEMKKWDTVGIDCVAMNVNDALCMGARPLAFVDYLAMEKTDTSMAEEIALGLKKGVDIAGIPIIGGETATLPEIINGFDLAGTCVGVIEKAIPQKVVPGDSIIGLRSSGLHSNGYTLARRVFEEKGYTFHEYLEGEHKKIGEVLLTPTSIYVKEIIALIKRVNIKAIAHITGGGLRKVKRISNDVCFYIEEPFEPHNIFKVIQKIGNISNEEMYQTFNMGMGMAIITSEKQKDETLAVLGKYPDLKARIVGTVKEGKGVVMPSLGLCF